MEKFLFFVIIIAVGIISGVVLLSKSTQPNTNIDLTGAITPAVTQSQIQTTSGPEQAQQQQQQTQPVGPENMITATKAIISTTKGDITLELYASDAAKTVSNFAKKAQSGFYKGLTFHRVEDWVIQGGDPKGDGTGGGNMATEINQRPFVVGSLGVARGQDITISNDAQFFITKKDASWLNGQYTNFGIVTSGMDVVNKIAIGDKILSITTE